MRQDFQDMLSGSRTTREAAQLSLHRGLRSIMIRMRRAGFTFVGLFAALAVYAVIYGTGFFGFLLAIMAIMLLSTAALFLPVRDRRPARGEWIEGKVLSRGKKPGGLDKVTGGTRDWLLRRCRELPRQAGPSLDRIVARLKDLEPSLASVPAESAVGGEAQRLIGRHLPDLIQTYLNLPVAERAGPHNASQLSASLHLLADHLDELCERVAQEKRTGFETENRFIEARYTNGDLGPGPLG